MQQRGMGARNLPRPERVELAVKNVKREKGLFRAADVAKIADLGTIETAQIMRNINGIKCLGHGLWCEA